MWGGIRWLMSSRFISFPSHTPPEGATMFGRKKPETITAGRLMQDEYRRAHLHALARDAATTGQTGPEYYGAGTISATQDEMDRVLGEGWLARAETTRRVFVGGTASHDGYSRV